MTIWTIYNHGTGGSSLKSEDKREIINMFGNADTRQRYRGKIINEGVGSIGDPHKLAREYSRTSDGEYWVKTDQGKAMPGSRLLKSMSGGGVQENVDNTVEFIRALNLNGQRPEGINMIGWSRGAVTCNRIAWKLYQSEDTNLRSIPINIFAVDPVAGAGHSNEVDACTITPNVRNYFATLAMGETRRFFKPIAGHRLIVTAPQFTNHWILPMPGHHSDTAKDNNNVGKLVFNLAYRFLAAAQTAVTEMRASRLEDIQAWKLYEDLMLGVSAVNTTKWHQQTLMGGTAYSRSNEGRAHSEGEDFFPNMHARLLMTQVFPLTYTAYFGPGQTDRNTPTWRQMILPRVRTEQFMGGMSPQMVRRLDSLPAEQGVRIPAGVLHMANAMGLVG